MSLGQARSKFGSIAGPGSPITLNGTALIAESKEEIERLDKELINNEANGSNAYYFITG